ncbi:hypothetical protein L484_015977 [Morus notabilis]|uniref:Uncharacterized protein n=1 Tax=Morus notabilis TaxID=981085 RepID=W9RR96_9ROSA|nr:hypothetical protein L484_015977 [Morus notabilis]
MVQIGRVDSPQTRARLRSTVLVLRPIRARRVSSCPPLSNSRNLVRRFHPSGVKSPSLSEPESAACPLNPNSPIEARHVSERKP